MILKVRCAWMLSLKCTQRASKSRLPSRFCQWVCSPLSNISNSLYMPSHLQTRKQLLGPFAFVIITFHERISSLSGDLGYELILKPKNKQMRERERKENRLTVTNLHKPRILLRCKPLEEKPEENRGNEVSFGQTNAERWPYKWSQMAAQKAGICHCGNRVSRNRLKGKRSSLCSCGDTPHVRKC